MGVLRGLFWLLVTIALLAIGLYVTGLFHLTDQFTALFLNLSAYLPATLDLGFEQFLVALTIVCAILAMTIIVGCAGLLGMSAAREMKAGARVQQAHRDIQSLKDAQQHSYEQTKALGQSLSKQLDKRMVIQQILEGSSRMASIAQANSIVSLWLLNFETDTFKFERGLYCDESLFLKPEFAASELPFARVIGTQQPWVSAEEKDGTSFIKPEKKAQLRVATGIILVPMIIENAVLGVLMLNCHPDVVKAYEEKKAYYELVWAQLTLALAIAVQGEVAILDRLTGVHNREYFMKRLVQEVERSNRYQLPISVIMVDLDRFKQVNDMLGHPQGDAVLKIISKILKKSIRAIDLAGRYGGEEFIIMLPETSRGESAAGAAGAMVVAERIRAEVEAEFKGMQKPLDLTISVGVLCRRFPEDRQMDYKDMIRLADEQLYKAKTTGKNKVCIYVPESAQEAPKQA